jgi:hypothetical protein
MRQHAQSPPLTNHPHAATVSNTHDARPTAAPTRTLIFEESMNSDLDQHVSYSSRQSALTPTRHLRRASLWEVAGSGAGRGHRPVDGQYDAVPTCEVVRVTAVPEKATDKAFLRPPELHERRGRSTAISAFISSATARSAVQTPSGGHTLVATVSRP